MLTAHKVHTCASSSNLRGCFLAFIFLFFKKKEVGGGGEYIKEYFKTTINFTIKNLQIDRTMNVIGISSPIDYFFVLCLKVDISIRKAVS